MTREGVMRKIKKYSDYFKSKKQKIRRILK